MHVEGGGGATSNIEPDFEVDQLLFVSVVRGYHICKRVWTTFVGEILTVGPETAERHAVCLVKDAQILGPVPRMALLDAQRTGNVCIKRCRLELVIVRTATCLKVQSSPRDTSACALKILHNSIYSPCT